MADGREYVWRKIVPARMAPHLFLFDLSKLILVLIINISPHSSFENI
jgi:hypothetical protein